MITHLPARVGVGQRLACSFPTFPQLLKKKKKKTHNPWVRWQFSSVTKGLASVPQDTPSSVGGIERMTWVSILPVGSGLSSMPPNFVSNRLQIASVCVSQRSL